MLRRGSAHFGPGVNICRRSQRAGGVGKRRENTCFYAVEASKKIANLQDEKTRNVKSLAWNERNCGETLADVTGPVSHRHGTSNDPMTEPHDETTSRPLIRIPRSILF